jgi:hypothetical protein
MRPFTYTNVYFFSVPGSNLDDAAKEITKLVFNGAIFFIIFSKL